MKQFTITIDKEVPPPVSEKPEDPRLPSLQQLEVGDSFFVEGVQRGDLRSLLYLGRRHGIYLITEYQERDSIYFKPGVRVWRVADPPKSRKRKATTPEPPPVVDIDDDEL